MSKTNSKITIALIIVLMSFIFILQLTSSIPSTNIEHLQKRQPVPQADDPPKPKDDPPKPKDDPPKPKED
ncbi:2322_t:CDS:2, partial [Entrophospora sp. SA101]